MFNLYIEQDKTNPSNYIIEPREDFVQYNSVLDWSAKLDVSKDVEVFPMSEANFKNLIFRYKSDQDYYNQLYEGTYKRNYADKLIITDNEFNQSDKTTELVFSATPVTAFYGSDIIAPKIFKINNNNAEPLGANIRILYWKGSTSCQPYTMQYNATSATYTTYNQATMMDDPLAPTVTLDWWNPFTLYYQYPGLQYTDNGLYGIYWSKFITEITDKDSKIIKAYLYLTETDIADFSFRKLIFIDDLSGGTYYLVNQIIDFNPNVIQTTQVELLKLKTGPSWAANVVLGGNGNGGGLGNGLNNAGYVYGGNGNINLNPNGVIIGGANNFMPPPVNP